MIVALRKRIKRVTDGVAPRTRIAIGQVFLLSGVLWMAIALGLIPNERNALIAGRARFCEAIAVYGSTFVQSGDLNSFGAALQAIAQRDPDVVSAAIRGADGAILFQVGDHATAWAQSGGAASVDSNIFVPLFIDAKKWGAVEVCFRSRQKDAGIIGLLRSSNVRLIAFISSASLLLFLIYLRKMLQHLDPSKVVPSRVRTALDTLAEGLLVVDRNERIVLANQAFASIVGRSPDELLGARAAQFRWIFEDNEPREMPWTRVLRESQPSHGNVMRLEDDKGVTRTFTVNCSPVLGHDGSYRGVLSSFDDVTQLEQKEIELRKSKDAAESANRAKSDFLARMSHEIRTPMNAILGFAEVLRRGYEQNELERQEYLDTIHASGQHLLELINDILDLSKIEAGKLEIELTRFSPNQLMLETLSILSVRAKQKGLSLEMRWETPAPETIETDATRLRQVIANLVGNAIKFTDSGSVRLAPRVFRGDDRKWRMTIDVIDTGIGMKPDALTRIFQPFAQADSSITRRFGGTGLGLSISRQIASALGGEINVTSEYGKGSCFSVTIQIGALEGVAMIEPSALQTSLTTARKTGEQNVVLPPTRVLLVEDGVSNRKLIMLVLGRAGAMVEFAEDGQRGTEMALAGQYDVILMDMQMPVMDGYTAARLLRSRGLTTPIIALTAHAMHGDEEKCREAGCSGFLTKPIDMDKLVRTIAGFRGAEGGVSAAAQTAQPSQASQTSQGINFAPTTTATPTPTPTSESPASAVAPAANAIGPHKPLKSTLPQDDPEFCEIVIEFVDRLDQQLAAIQKAYVQEDLAELASLAHWLKGSGGTAGFAAFTEPAKKLEMLAREKKLAEIGGAIESLRGLASGIEAPPAPARRSTVTEPA